jgi:glutamyl-tRNA synthetase
MHIHSRIAPTPSGFLHVGNAYAFAVTDYIVSKSGGTLRLRIDDLDAPRVRSEYIQDIFDTLDWMGITEWYGPKDAMAFSRNFSQQQRLNDYFSCIEALIETGLTYACNCSRSSLLAMGHHTYPGGICRRKKLSPNEPNTALRLVILPEKMPIRFFDYFTGQAHAIDLTKEMGDFVIRRKDGLPAYQIASLCDDVTYGINTIVRGNDLLTSTAAQLYLADLLGKTNFLNAHFFHHPLLTSASGEKLSKSAGSSSIKQLRANGYLWSDVKKQLPPIIPAQVL